MEEFITGTGQHLKVHSKEDCKGHFCPIHNPSNHCMKDFPLHWRDDKRIFERICEHGVGHPDPDDLAFKTSLGVDIEYFSMHGCDGCCHDKDVE
jgi:hypothetical protein